MKIYIVTEGDKLKCFQNKDNAETYYEALKLTGSGERIEMQEHTLIGG